MPEGGLFLGRNNRALNLGAAVMFDYTLDSFPISFGGGFYLGAFAWLPVDPGGSLSGGFAGPLIRSAFYPVIVRGDGGVIRDALYLGVDLGLYRTLYEPGGLVFAPTLSVGLQRF
jgi:hypothetical protein